MVESLNCRRLNTVPVWVLFLRPAVRPTQALIWRPKWRRFDWKTFAIEIAPSSERRLSCWSDCLVSGSVWNQTKEFGQEIIWVLIQIWVEIRSYAQQFAPGRLRTIKKLLDFEEGLYRETTDYPANWNRIRSKFLFPRKKLDSIDKINANPFTFFLNLWN